MTNQPTKAEIAKAREIRREIALRNLKSESLMSLAIAYHANSKESGYGVTDNEAVHQSLYLPAIRGDAKAYDLKSGEEYDLMEQHLIQSRVDGELYSGQFVEKKLLKDSAETAQSSLIYVKVRDVYELLESDKEVKEKIDRNPQYRNKYVSELLESEDEEAKKFAQYLISGYMDYITTEGVSKALDERKKLIKGGLEGIVTSEKNPFAASSNGNRMRMAA